MKRWMERIFSNKYLRVAIISFIVMFLIAFWGLTFLFLAGSRMSAEILSVWVATFEVVIMILGTIVTIFVIIMGIRLIIYGNEVKHDEGYWKIQSLEEGDKVMEAKNDPYLLPVRLKNPVVPFLLLLCCYNVMPLFITCFYLQAIFTTQFTQIAIAFILGYVMVVALVIFVRLLRRLKPFRVKQANNCQQGE